MFNFILGLIAGVCFGLVLAALLGAAAKGTGRNRPWWRPTKPATT